MLRWSGGVPKPPVPPLTFDARLHEAARRHSEDMAARGYVAHVSPEGVMPSD
ncbi:MAG: hypothetical protein HYV07_15235, partial [Deltaproteobacteria bacterium]|nr:hypothetical protein [Deltaproteobacteria bacterium]